MTEPAPAQMQPVDTSPRPEDGDQTADQDPNYVEVEAVTPNPGDESL